MVNLAQLKLENHNLKARERELEQDCHNLTIRLDKVMAQLYTLKTVNIKLQGDHVHCPDCHRAFIPERT